MAEYLPRKKMIDAGVDSLSRMGEFSVSSAVFRRFNKMEGFGVVDDKEGFTLDLFAFKKTAKVKRYCSRGGAAGSVGDARSFRLAGDENFWACPPLPVIAMAVMQLCGSPAPVTLIVPDWPNQAWHVRLREVVAAAVHLKWHPGMPVMWDVSDRDNKHAHLVDKWDYVAFAVGGSRAPGRLCLWSGRRAVSEVLKRTRVAPKLRRRQEGLKNCKGAVLQRH